MNRRDAPVVLATAAVAGPHAAFAQPRTPERVAWIRTGGPGAQRRGDPVSGRLRPASRRAFVSRTLALAAACGLATGPDAREAGRPPAIGYLSLFPTSGPPSPERRAFLDALAAAGHVDGTTMRIEYRSAGGDRASYAEAATELVQADVELIVATSTDAAKAARQATSRIPIVFVGIADPVRAGLVTSLARPSGNATGVSRNAGVLIAKQFELIREILPGAKRVAILYNPASEAVGSELESSSSAARGLALALETHAVNDPPTLAEALRSIGRRPAHAMLTLVDPRIVAYREIIAEHALRNRLPSFHGYRGFAAAGGLVAYAPRLDDIYRRGAAFVDRILRGARPQDLPVEEPSTFELILNARTATAIGVVLPAPVLARADEVIR